MSELTKAFGDAFEMALAISRTIPAFVLNKSSRVMPGLRGTPAGMTITSASKCVKSHENHPKTIKTRETPFKTKTN